LGGRTTLRDELSRRGASVDELACYRRRPPVLAPGVLAARLREWGIGLVMISSGEGLANLLALLSPEETSNFVHMTLLVPSVRVAHMAREAGFKQVVTADNASDDAMLRALAQWQSNAGE
jgi:uroporphyrinogen-III synthase